MGWSYISPFWDIDGSGQDTLLCFLSMHLVFGYYIVQIKKIIKKNTEPSHRSFYWIRITGLKWEVNSWVRGNNSQTGLQIIDVFWLSVCDCNCNSVSVLADVCGGGIFTWCFSDAFLMSLNHCPSPHSSSAVTKWEANKDLLKHTLSHTPMRHALSSD